MSLRSYVEHPEYGMRGAHSHPNESSSSSSSSSVPVDPPLYLFSGPEQVGSLQVTDSII